MAEIYSLHLENDKLCFTQGNVKLPDCVLEAKFTPDTVSGIEVVCRMGDPDLLHCIVYKNTAEGGGIFSLHDKGGLLFAAAAPNNLIYGLALGYFGELTANARYGVDVFENLEEPDD